MLIDFNRAGFSVFQNAAPDEQSQLMPFRSGRPVTDDDRRTYAAWLRARGDLRGELLALAVALTDSPRPDDAQRARVTELLAGVDPAWWRLVQPRPYLLNCGAARDRPAPIRFAFQCPMQWPQLAGTDDPAVRRCDRCGEDVHRADTLAAADAHARLGHCISVPAELAAAHADRRTSITGRPAHPVHRWAEALFGQRPVDDE